jgi:hypothetical protein
VSRLALFVILEQAESGDRGHRLSMDKVSSDDAGSCLVWLISGK